MQPIYNQMQAERHKSRGSNMSKVFSFSLVLCRRPCSSTNISKLSAPGRHGWRATKFQVSSSLDFQSTDVLYHTALLWWMLILAGCKQTGRRRKGQVWHLFSVLLPPFPSFSPLLSSSKVLEYWTPAFPFSQSFTLHALHILCWVNLRQGPFSHWWALTA